MNVQARTPMHQSDSTKLELRKLRRTRMDFGRASALELLWGLLTSSQVLRPSKPCLSLYSTRTKLGSTLEAKLTFFTVSARRSRGVFIEGLSRCFGWKWCFGGPLVRPASHLVWSGSQVSWPLWVSHHESSSYRLNMTHVESVISLVPNPSWLAKEWGRLAPPCVGWAQAFCHVISPCHIIWDYPWFWT
jgi:hypothetical protein